MKKIVSLLIAFILVFSFAACSSDGGEKTQTNTDITVDLNAVKAEMIQTLSPSDPIELSAQSLLDLYGIAAEDIEASACYTTMDGVFPEEVIMIKAKDSDALARIEEKMNNRIAEVKVQSQNYDAENYALAQKCGVKSDGLYVTLFISPNVEEMTNMFYKG
jgi:hypothetical protein